MYDPRWDDARERDDGRARVYDERDRADHDPRDGLTHDLDLPRGEARELVVDRDHMYELNGEDSRALAVVGAFRVVPEPELGSDRDDARDRDTLDHLRDEGLIRTIALGEHDQAVVLTDEGRDLLDANRRERDEGESQVFYAGVNRPRELDHDAHLYATSREEEARLRQEHGHVEVRRVVLEQDLKREYQKFLQDHNRDRSDSDGRPDRDEEEIHRWARDHELPYFDDRVHFPDFRIEYEVDGREHHQDVEVLTQHYRGGHAAGRARAGFRFRMFLLRHAEMFRMLHTWTVRVLVPRRFWKAAALYKAALRDELWTPLEPHITDRLEAYFRERRQDGGHLSDPSDEYLIKAFRRYGRTRFASLYRAWRCMGDRILWAARSTILRDARERGWGTCDVQPLTGQYLQLTGLIDRDDRARRGAKRKIRAVGPPPSSPAPDDLTTPLVTL